MAPSTAVRVNSISPLQGSTTGGTNLTINGTNFAGDATVTIGGVPATNVVFEGATSLRAVVGSASVAGAVDVVVTSGGQSATLAKAFTFVAPSGSNRPPVVTGIRSVGSRPGQPFGFADQDETVTLIATVTDDETSTNSLTYEWTGAGSFSATEPITIWRLPSTVSPAPSPVTATLTVTETYVEGSVTHRNVTTAPFVIQVHDSQKEVLDMGEDFLRLFSQSNIPTDQVLHNFSTACDGRASEADDTSKARRDYVQDYSKFTISRLTPVLISFGGRCPVFSERGDACSAFVVHWEITYIRNVDGYRTGDRIKTDGTDYVSAIVENNQWRLCSSRFSGRSTNTLTGATRLVEW